ncbi:MAG: TRAM domain-containing protein [Candidatus Nanohaloarchaea archaeon]
MSDDFDQQFDDDFDDDFETDEEEFEEDFDEAEEEETEEVQEEPEEESYDASEEDEEEDFDKPVSEGETVEVDIEDLGSKGDGIARVEGFVVFVPGGEVGESYDVEITSVGRKFAFAEIVD